METKLTNVKDNIYSVTISIPAKEATSAYNTAAGKIAQYVNIDGFRKGKAPRAVVERHVGVDRIEHEALDMILPKYISKAIYDNKLDTVVINMVIEKFNRIGNEGVNSVNYSGVSESFIDDYSTPIVRQLKRHRRLVIC